MEDRGRPDIPRLRKLAAWSWRLLVILTAAGLALYLLILLKVIVVPVIVALFLATLLVPLVQLAGGPWLVAPAGGADRVRRPPFLLLVAIILGFIPLISNELDMLRHRADEGVAEEVQRFIASPRPFGLSEEDLNRFLEQAREHFTAEAGAASPVAPSRA